MAYFPMFVSLERKPCLIVGGGMVAARKCRGLLAFGAEVTMVAERFTEETEGSASGRLQRIQRSFQETDLTMQSWAVVIGATNSRSVNHTVAVYCQKAGIPVNIADCQEECSFFFPAYCTEGWITAGVSTSGRSPAVASAVRKRLESALPKWIAAIEKEGAEDGKRKPGDADRDERQRPCTGADSVVRRGVQEGGSDLPV